MNRFGITSAVIAIVASAGVAMATPHVTYNGQSAAWGPTTNGGPFVFTPINGFTPNGLGLNQAGAGRFISFCLERNESLPTANYDIQIATSANLGGVGGGSPDPLDAATAYLYSKFMGGGLSAAVAGFTYSTGVATTAVISSGNALQAAIWFIENEISSIAALGLDASTSALATALVNKAMDEKNLVNGGTWGNTLGDVRVLNLIDDVTGEQRQSQLVLVPLPGGVGMATAGMAGLFGAGVLRRRRR